MFTDIEIHKAAKLYVPQCRRSALAGARSLLYKGLDSMRDCSWELVVIEVRRLKTTRSAISQRQRMPRFAWSTDRSFPACDRERTAKLFGLRRSCRGRGQRLRPHLYCGWPGR